MKALSNRLNFWTQLIIGFLLGLSNGFAIVTAQKFGARDIKEADMPIGTA